MDHNSVVSDESDSGPVSSRDQVQSDGDAALGNSAVTVQPSLRNLLSPIATPSVGGGGGDGGGGGGRGAPPNITGDRLSIIMRLIRA